MRHCLIWIVGILVLWLWPLSAQAATCSVVDGQSVCIHNLQRSAKNYWEYRVQFKIAGIVQPIEIYDCLNRRKSTISGHWEPLVGNSQDALACRLFRR
jgi:hypothetical protein